MAGDYFGGAFMSLPQQPGRLKLLYLFEDYVLDDRRHELRRGAEIVSLEPKAFDLLLCLIRNREQVVTHDDLRAQVWEGRLVSVSTLGSTINAARGAVADSGEAQRLIQTVPRKGFRFVGLVSEREAPVPETSAAIGGLPAEIHPVRGSAAARPAASNSQATLIVSTAAVTSVATTTTPAARTSRAPLLATGTFLGFVIAVAAYFIWLPPSPHRPVPLASQKFDASVVPLVSDEARHGLSSYPARPDIKILAIGSDRFSVVDNATDVERAKQEALRQCSSAATRCRIYAVGIDVVWSRESMPMADAGDLRTEPLAISLVPEHIPTLSGRRKEIIKGYMKGLDHRAMALTTGRTAYVTARSSKAEAARMAVERCSERTQRPCLVLSVNGSLTVQIPKTRKIDRIFLPSTEESIPDEHKKRIAAAYGGPEWRALARGRNGSWHPVADAPSEDAAIATAMAACGKSDQDCKLYAIGNFRVAQD